MNYKEHADLAPPASLDRRADFAALAGMALPYDDAGIIVTPFDFHQSLRTRIRKGITWAIFGVLAVVLGLILLLTVVEVILHLPFLLPAWAWCLGVDKLRSRKKAGSPEVAGELSPESLQKRARVSRGRLTGDRTCQYPGPRRVRQPLANSPVD